jgi:sterol desaturase/sphingolipid hydroxylase (fatty acid hydroxylase superfamily)
MFALTVLLIVAAEIGWRTLIAKRGYDGKAAAASLGVAVGNIFAGGLTALITSGVYVAAARIAPMHWPATSPWTIAVAFVLVEFTYYWFHRFSHTVRWLWASHAVHHSANVMTLPAAIRLGWTNLISGGWLMFLPLILAGFDPRLVVILLAIGLRYQFFLHTEAVPRLGPLEWVLNTPSHHRVHHASNPGLIDKNFGGMVIVFDRLFGTFAAEPKHEALRYGLVHKLTSKNPFVIAFHEWGRMARDIGASASLGGAFKAAFGRPA